MGVTVNFVCQLDWSWGAQVFGQTLFCVFLQGCVGMRLTFKSVEHVKQSARGLHPIG